MKHFWKYTLCVLSILTGLAAFGVKSTVDVRYWYDVGVTYEGKLQLAAVAVVFCMASMVFTFVLASRLRDLSIKNVIGTAFGAVVLVYVTGYGMSSIVGFGAREISNPYAIAKATHVAEADAVAATNTLRQKAVNGQLAYLQDQGRVAGGPKRATAAYAGAGEVISQIAVQALPVDTSAMVDPNATLLHHFAPTYSVEDIQNIRIGALGVGLLLIELCGIGLGVGMWPRAEAKARVADGGRLMSEPYVNVAAPAATPALPSASIIHPPQFVRPAQAAIVEEPVEPEPEETPVQAGLFSAVDEHMSAADQVGEFWKEATVPCRNARISCSNMYDFYIEWCKGRDLTPAKIQLFGDVSAAHCEKNRSHQWHYVGRAVLGEDRSKIAA